MRNTIQKSRILEYLKGVKTHPTARQVYEAVRKEMPTITLATVYRNLNMMAERGEITRFETGKEYRFDADMSKHLHMVCKTCGKILDFFDKELHDTAMAKTFKGFEPESVSIIYHGRCEACMKQ